MKEDNSEEGYFPLKKNYSNRISGPPTPRQALLFAATAANLACAVRQQRAPPFGYPLGCPSSFLMRQPIRNEQTRTLLRRHRRE